MRSTRNTDALPGAQGKKRGPPLSIQIRQNVRLENRFDTTLGPTDAKYQETEKYFAALLEDTDWTIARILDEHFLPHEAKKFTPTRESPYAEWQADDARAFERLLQTRFKGVKPTLSMKMALFYHGFSVAPMKIGLQEVEPRDHYDFAKHENMIIQDPLNFLEGFTERTWGEPPHRPSLPPRRVPLVTEAMGLRGGGLEDAEMEDILSDADDFAGAGDAGYTRPSAKTVIPPSLFVHPRRTAHDEDKRARDKKTKLYNSQAEFRTGSGTNEAMRKQAWWVPPSIFANPLKPIMPIHAAPLETVIRTGPSVPSVSLGLRTSTEMARLEREVHMLRGHLLDRNRECPYHDCHKFFHYLDTESFEYHLTQEHAIVRCALCVAFSPGYKHAEMLYMDRERIIEHVATEHAEQLKAFIGDPTSRKTVNSPSLMGLFARYQFCGRCGRDNKKCCESEDLRNHMLRCSEPDWNPALESRPEYCESCGMRTGSRWPNRNCRDKECASHNPDLADEERFCRKCGLCWNGNHPEVYKARHKSGCRPMGGTDDSFCVCCGVSLQGLDAHGVQKHGRVCMARPETEATHNAEQNPHSRGYGEEYVEGPVRETVESWDPSLGEEPHLETRFEPEPESHCSRCFLQAKDCEKPELHANKDLSCNIRWGKGSAENLPNVSGWVSRGDLEARGIPADEILRQSAQNFVTKHPEYAATISNAYVRQPSANGGSSKTSSSSSGDPNVDMLLSESMIRYPWPPSKKRPTADPQGKKHAAKKRRQIFEDSGSEPSSDGDEVSFTDSDDDYEEEAFETHAKQGQPIGTSAHQAPQPPPTRQGSTAPAAKAARPRAIQKSATPAASTAKKAGNTTPKTTGAASSFPWSAPTGNTTPKTTGATSSFPWPAPKAQNTEKPLERPVDVTVGESTGWGGNLATASQPVAAAATPAAVRKSPVSPAKKAKTLHPESGSAAAAPKETTATTRSGRTIRKTRAAAELPADKSARPAGQGDVGKDGHDDGEATKVKTPAPKKGRPKKQAK